MTNRNDGMRERPSAEEVLSRPICPMTWLTNEKHCIYCDHDCAWFDQYADVCAILAISRAVQGLDESGQHIRVIAMERAKRDGVL